MGIEVGRGGRDGGGAKSDGLVELAGAALQAGQIEQCLSMLRIQPNCRLKCDFRFGFALLRPQDQPQIVMVVGNVTAKRDGAGDQVFGQSFVASLMYDHAQQMPSLGIVRVLVDDPAITRRRAIEVPLGVEPDGSIEGFG